MKRLFVLFLRHHAKLWALTTVLVAGLIVTMAPGPRLMPGQYEYKTVIFKVDIGQSATNLQNQFNSVLNRESAAGWEFDGRCARLADDQFGIDYIVFRRRVQ